VLCASELKQKRRAWKALSIGASSYQYPLLTQNLTPLEEVLFHHQVEHRMAVGELHHADLVVGRCSHCTEIEVGQAGAIGGGDGDVMWRRRGPGIGAA